MQVEGEPEEATLHRLRAGVDLGDFVTRPAQVRRIADPPNLWERVPPIRHRKSIPTSWIEFVLREGKNRQLRRMTAAAGYPALLLIRLEVGPRALSGLEPGRCRLLDPDETPVAGGIGGV